jgi:hypothetical protein
VIPFPAAGTYYDYFTGDSIVVRGTTATCLFGAGEFHVLTTKNLPNPDRIGVPLGVEDEREFLPMTVMPNPSEGSCMVQLPAALSGENSVLEVVSQQGNVMCSVHVTQEQIALHDLPTGVYVVIVRQNNAIRARQKVVVVN